MKTHRIQRTWFIIGALFFMLLSILSCSSNAALLDTHGFSNLVLDKDTLWFGAGYKLYRVDLNKQAATLVYDTKDVVISFVQLDEKELYFGGYQSLGRDGTVWSLDIDSKDVLWQQEFKGNWFESGSIVMPPLIDEEVIIVGTRTVLYSIDKAKGEIKWQTGSNRFGDGESLSPILNNEQLFYGSTPSSNQIVIADPSLGKTLRTLSVPGSLGGVPAVHSNYLFVKDYQSYRRDNTGKLQWIGELRLNRIDLSSGKTIWTFHGNGVSALSQPSFYKDLVLDVFANQLYAIDEQSGELLWQSPSLEAAARNPQVIEELATGELRNEALLNTLSSPVFVGQQAIYGTINAVVCVDIGTGDVIWSIPVDSKYQIPYED